MISKHVYVMDHWTIRTLACMSKHLWGTTQIIVFIFWSTELHFIDSTTIPKWQPQGSIIERLQNRYIAHHWYAEPVRNRCRETPSWCQ